MKSYCKFNIFLLIVYNIFILGRALVLLRRFENCDQNANYEAKYYNITFKIIDNNQYFNGTAIVASPLEDTLQTNITIDMLTGKNYVYLFSITEKKTCDAMHKYLGEFAYDLERHAQKIPGLCPLPKVLGAAHLLVKRFENCDANGNYELKHNNISFKIIDNRQYFNGTMIATSPLDNTFQTNVTIDTLIGKNYVYLFSINEKKTCDAMHKYFGEFVYDLERHAQQIPGMCSIPKV